MRLWPVPNRFTVSEQSIEVTVVYAPRARCLHEVALTLASTSSVSDALISSGLAASPAALMAQNLQVGVWGRKVRCDHPLRDGDRVELYRILRVDPKVARRERFVKQGARAAGLFAKRSPSVIR